MWEALAIILVLGGLEAILWYISERRNIKEMAEQTQLLEDIAVTLSLRENGNSKEENVKQEESR